MSPQKTAGKPVVAELGRPETAQETVARKAESSRNHRQRQTVNNLVYSLLACLAIVAIVVLMVPRSAPTVQKNVDYIEVAKQGQGTEPDALATPDLPKSWTSNSAELSQGTGNNIDTWYIGLLSPSKQYIGFTQGFDANDTWVANLLSNTSATGTTTIDGVKWIVYDNRNSTQDVGNAHYGLVTTAGQSTYVLVGGAPTSEFRTVASSLAQQITTVSEK